MKELINAKVTIPQAEIQILIFEEDWKLIRSTLHGKNLHSGWITLNTHKRINGIYEFQPKGKSYYINIYNQ